MSCIKKTWNLLIVIGIITLAKFIEVTNMGEKIKLTKAGYKKLEEELRYKIDIERDEVKRQLAEASAQGDLSENADYDAARAKQAEVEGRIKEIEEILNNCEIIGENTKGNRVG